MSEQLTPEPCQYCGLPHDPEYSDCYEPEMREPPIRLCCGQRHLGPVCLDGMVMCCLCFNRFEQDKLNITSGGLKEDVCKECAQQEAGREPEDEGRWSLRDEGRSDGHGESYGEPNT